MVNQWRSNLWIVIELVIVSITLWPILSMLTGLMYVKFQPRGYNMDDIYVANINLTPVDSPLFQQRDSDYNYLSDRDILVNNLRANRFVELVGLGRNATSYNYNYHGLNLYARSGDSTITYNGNQRTVTPDVIRIYRLESLDGKSNEQLAEVIERGELLLSDFDPAFKPDSKPAESFAGKDIYFDNVENPTTFHVGGLARGVRRSDYEPLFSGVIYMPLRDEWATQVIIRVKPGMGTQFVESLTDADRQVGNVFLTSMTSIEKMKKQAHKDIDNFMTGFVTTALFLMTVIFLGFVGTFWFRTARCEGEIAIRMVSGATKSNIFRRFIGEGLLLLSIALVIDIIPVYLIIDSGIIDLTGTTGAPEWLIYPPLAVTAALLALMIVAGVWAPARKAMSVNPAFALKEQ